MFLLKITVKPTAISDEKMTQHRQWFKQYFDAGNFKIVGPFNDIKNAGVIIAQASSKDEMKEIISHDAFYPAGADYELHEFKANLVAKDITSE